MVELLLKSVNFVYLFTNVCHIYDAVNTCTRVYHTLQVYFLLGKKYTFFSPGSRRNINCVEYYKQIAFYNGTSFMYDRFHAKGDFWMELRKFLTIKALISIIFGLLFLLFPAFSMSIFGVSLDAVGVMVTRYFGVVILGIGLICAFYRSKDFRALVDLLLALFITGTLGFIVALSAQLSGLLNFLGWLVVLIWLLLAIGLGYFRFSRP